MKSLKDELRLNDRDLTVLQAHLSVLPRDLRQDSPKWSYKSVTALLERANGMDDSTFNRAERRLEERGLLRRNISANGRRFPVFHPDTRAIVGAYGVDLQPLFDQLSAFGALAADVERERLHRMNLVTRISSWLGNIRRALLQRLGDVPESFRELARELRRITRRKELSIADLAEMEGRLQQLEETYLGDGQAKTTAPPCPADNSVVPGDDHQNERHIESDEKDSKKRSDPCPAEDDPQKIENSWSDCRSVSDLYGAPPRTGRDLCRILYQFSSFLAVKDQLTLQAIETLGPRGALVALDYIAGRLDRLRNPEGYLMSMITAYRAGHPIAGGRLPARRGHS